MPDKQKTTEKEVDKVEEKAPAESAPETVSATQTRGVVKRSTPPWPLIALGAFATVVTIALIVVSWMLIASHRQARQQVLGANGQFGPGSSSYGNNANGGQYFRRGRGALQAAAARGVVTAVNGDSFTVSGAGKQVTVNKSSATITGDKSDIAVNDTVTVYGTTDSDGTVTATRVLVSNSGVPGRAMMDDSFDDSADPSQVPGA
jgi:hypothetical protein